MKTFIILTVLLASVFQVRSADNSTDMMVTTEETSSDKEGKSMMPMISCKECNPDEGIKLMCETKLSNDLIGDYVWEKNGEVLPDKNSATLEPSEEGNYTCQTRKDEKMSEKSMMLALKMNDDSKLAKIPMMPMLKCEDCSGKEVSLVCIEDPDLNGTDGVEYVWKKDGKPLVYKNGTMMMKVMVDMPGKYTCMTKRSNVASEESRMLQLTEDGGKLKMKSDDSGDKKGTTSPVTTTMSSGTTQMKPNINCTGCPNDVEKLKCVGAKNIPYEYVWKINDDDQNMNKMTIEPTKGGEYTCMTKKDSVESGPSDMLKLMKMTDGTLKLQPKITCVGCPSEVKKLMCVGDTGTTYQYVWKINGTTDVQMTSMTIEPTKGGDYTCMTKKDSVESGPSDMLKLVKMTDGSLKRMTATTTTTETTTPELPHQQQANQTQPPNMQTTGVEPTTMTKKSVSNGSNGGISSNPPGSEGGNGGDDENKGDMTTGGETENAAVSLNRNSASILNTILAAVAVTTLIRSQLA